MISIILITILTIKSFYPLLSELLGRQQQFPSRMAIPVHLPSVEKGAWARTELWRCLAVPGSHCAGSAFRTSPDPRRPGRRAGRRANNHNIVIVRTVK